MDGDIACDGAAARRLAALLEWTVDSEAGIILWHRDPEGGDGEKVVERRWWVHGQVRVVRGLGAYESS